MAGAIFGDIGVMLGCLFVAICRENSVILGGLFVAGVKCAEF